jgi:putative membrane protein
VWLGVVMGAYDIGFWRALLLALALTFLSWVVSALFGIRTFRAD